MTAPHDFDRLAEALQHVFAEGVIDPWPADRFGALARRVFGVQYDGSAAYAAYCRGRGVSPDGLERWEDIPPVPASAWKHLDLVVGDPAGVECVFRTSGTTGGAQARGRHLVRRLSLYRAAVLPTFARHVLGGRRRMPFLSLIPSPADCPDSSLSAMIDIASGDFATEVEWLVDAEGRLDRTRLASTTKRLRAQGKPVLAVGTALAFRHLLDLPDGTREFVLPQGSRVMETGGFKGSDRAINAHELYQGIHSVLGVRSENIVNEYGMTELLSQLYRPGGAGAHGSPHVPPPWMRVRSLDPTTLAPLPVGTAGLLCFFDLANLGSVSHVLTEDWGAVDALGRVTLQGRMTGAEPRGCSRAMDQLMSAVGKGA